MERRGGGRAEIKSKMKWCKKLTRTFIRVGSGGTTGKEDVGET